MMRDRSRIYRQENKEKVTKSRKLWCQQNKEEISAYNKKRRDADIGKAIERVRKWRALNPEISKESGRRSRARRRTARLRALVAATHRQVIARKKLFENKCAYCGSGGKMAMDHVLAIKAGGLDEASNLVPACFSCNGSKGAKPVETWYRLQPFFSAEKWRKICKHCPCAASSQLSISLPA
jgi:5-methylcytosine-specific restriction endonuclease McrA